MVAVKNRKVKAAYTRTRIKTDVPERQTKAVQSEKKHSDINNIVAKAYQTGQLPVLVGRQPVQPLPDVQTYQDALNKVVFAQQEFERLPSHIRNQFENKPEKMLAALGAAEKDPALKKSLQEMGILETPPPVPTDKAKPAPQEPPEPPGDDPANPPA